MNNDFISKSALLNEIENGKNKPKICDCMQKISWINECIQNAPVVYDFDSVITLLKNRCEETYYKSVENNYLAATENVAYNNALKIVNSGIISNTNRLNKKCKAYCGIACVDGSCPIANAEEYAERCMDVVRECIDCHFYLGCIDCCFWNTEYCIGTERNANENS